MIFSQAKNKFRITSAVFIVSLTKAYPTSVFLTPLTVSEQNYQVLVCIFLIRM